MAAISISEGDALDQDLHTTININDEVHLPTVNTTDQEHEYSAEESAKHTRWVRDEQGDYIPICPVGTKPAVGMRFNELDEGLGFYKRYGQYSGFMTRKGTQKTTKMGISLKYITCSREGERIIRAGDHDEEFRQYTKRRCLTTRTGCRAMMSLKLGSDGVYTVQKFMEAHNHPFYTPEHFQELRLNRNLNDTQRQFIMDCQRVSIGATAAYNVCSSMVGGEDHVGATVTDFRNCQRDLKVFIAESDVQMVIDEFITEQQIDTEFYYEYEHDEGDRLTRMFWADGLSRLNYTRWGDCVSFDSTYGTNRYSMVFCPFTGVDNHNRCVTFAAALISKEDAESYIWVFNCFMRAMLGQQPLCIITDQDNSIKNAIGQVLPASRHRFCMWHIMKKVPEKVRRIVPFNSPFHGRLNSIVWTDKLNPSEFESEWEALMDEYSLSFEDCMTKLYDIRSSWIPAYFKDLPMGMLLRTTSRSESQNSTFGFNASKILTLKEFMWRFNGVVKSQRRQHLKLVTQYAAAARPSKHSFSKLEIDAWNIYTRPLFNMVRSDILDGIFHCSIMDIDKDEGITRYTIGGTQGEIVKVLMEEVTSHCHCTCRRLEGKGLICMHIFAALNAGNIQRIPRSMVKERWCRDPPSYSSSGPVSLLDKNKQPGRMLLHIEVWSTVQSILCNKDTTESDVQQLLNALNEHRVLQVVGSTSSTPKGRKTIEQLTGITRPPVVTVQLPTPCKNKGSGRRLQSEREKAVTRLQAKGPRKCTYCLGTDGHTKRGCPQRIWDESSK